MTRSTPAGWTVRTLADLVEILDSKRVPVNAKERATRVGGVPYYGATGQVGTIDSALFDEDLVLLGEDGVQFFDPSKPKAYRITGPAWVNNHAHVLRAGHSVDWRYLEHYLNAFDYRGFANGTTRLKLTQSAMRQIPIAYPSLVEQGQIVELLDGHLSRIVYASETVARGSRGLTSLTGAILCDLIPEHANYPRGWTSATVGDAGRVELGRQRHPDWHSGPNMGPYLRVANVFEDRIDTTDVMEMHWPEDTFERFRLQPGDILLNEGQSPQYLGRPALYRGEPADVAFTNSLIRFTSSEDVLPEFALLVFRRHMHAGRFMREARITTNIAHLSASRFKKMEFPIPPLSTQREVVATAGVRLGGVERLRMAVSGATHRASLLRRTLLAAAFAGQLTGATADSDRVSDEAELGQEALAG